MPTGSVTSGPRIWITRTQPGAQRTAERLSLLGYQPLIAPLLEVQPLPQALDGLTDLARFQTLAFTSPNGVAAFCALTPDLRNRPVYCVGDTTAQAARDAGFTSAVSAAGAIEDLARLILKDRANGPLLAPGAREPAGDLPALLTDLSVTRLPVYAAFETNLAAPDAYEAVLVHSPRAARALAHCLTPAQAARTIAITISAAASAPLASLGLKEIHTSGHPDENSMISTLGKRLGPV